MNCLLNHSFPKPRNSPTKAPLLGPIMSPFPTGNVIPSSPILNEDTHCGGWTKSCMPLTMQCYHSSRLMLGFSDARHVGYSTMPLGSFLFRTISLKNSAAEGLKEKWKPLVLRECKRWKPLRNEVDCMFLVFVLMDKEKQRQARTKPSQ